MTAALRLLVIIQTIVFLSACGGGGGSSDSDGGATPPPIGGTSGGINDPKTISAVEKAISTGILGDATSEALLQAANTTLQNNANLFRQDKIRLLQLAENGDVKSDSLNSLSWNVTHDAAQLTPGFGFNDTLLLSNADSTTGDKPVRTLAILGKQNQSPYLVFGSNPMRTLKTGAETNEQMQQLMRNSIEWLAGRSNFSEQPLRIVLSHMDQSFYFPDDSAAREWLEREYPNTEINPKDQCNGSAMSSCLMDGTTKKADILLVSQHSSSANNETAAENDAVINAVSLAQQNGIGVWYLHLDGDLTSLGNALLSHLNVTYRADNYWERVRLSNQNMQPFLTVMPPRWQNIQNMLTELGKQRLNYNWDACDGENCSGVTDLQQNFLPGADEIRSIYRNTDSNNTDIFSDQNNYRMEKILALLGDSYRKDLSFPMDKVATTDTEFVRALYADYSQYNSRQNNPVASDLGNFSRTDFSHISPADKRIHMVSKRNFRAAGVYALPGHTFTVTRNDNTDADVKVFINTQRSGATHVYAENGYNRPLFLQSPHVAIKPGQTVTLTSSYGGPVQLEFNENGHTVDLMFNQVGLHPYWDGVEDNAEFATQLTEAEFDWSEISTDGFEVHSKTDKMQRTVENWEGDTAAELATATMRYAHNFPHVLAGFQGDNIDVVAEIHDFARDKNWPIHIVSDVKHMNADQATCGYGCSGNPYDAYWDFSPTGHGDLHELGHGLERWRFRFEGWELHASTNFYSYYSKWRYFQDTGNDPSCQSLPFRDLYELLQESLTKNDPLSFMQSQNMRGWTNGATMYLQMMMSAQAAGALTDGWNLLPRLHIHERVFNSAINSDESWAQFRNSLGFSDYSREEANNLSNTDYLNIALSTILNRDMRNYLRTWGYAGSAKTATQLNKAGLTQMPVKYFQADGSNFCRGLNKAELPLNGSSAWPESR